MFTIPRLVVAAAIAASALVIWLVVTSEPPARVVGVDAAERVDEVVTNDAGPAPSSSRQPAPPPENVEVRNAADEPAAGAPTFVQGTAWRRLRGMAGHAGLSVPADLRGNDDLWASIEQIDREYGVARAISAGLFSKRMNELVRAQMDGSRSGLVPRNAFRSVAGKPIYRPEGRGDLALRTVGIGAADGSYELHVPRGEDPRLDELEDEIDQTSAAAKDAVLAVLQRHRVPLSSSK